MQPLLRHQASDGDHLDRALKHYRKTRKSLDDLAVNDRDRTPIRPEYVARLADQLATDNAVFTVRRWLTNHLGGTVPDDERSAPSDRIGRRTGPWPGPCSHAIGAQTVDRGRQVVALAGDGGLTMLFGELVTLKQNRLPVKVIVFNNSSLGFVELEMKAAGIVNFGTDLAAVDFASVAQRGRALCAAVSNSPRTLTRRC